MKGLLARRSLTARQGLLLRPASALHALFMRFPIDLVLLDRELAVVAVVADVRPWRAAGRHGARAVLELPAGEAARRRLRSGDRFHVG